MCPFRNGNRAARLPRKARPLATTTLLLLAAAVPAAAQWTNQAPQPTYLDVRGVGAPAAGHVFLATADNSFDTGGALWESVDGGATWTQRDVPESLGDPLNGLFFLDALNGWAYGNANYRTTDGGATWTALPLLGSTYFMEFSTPAFGVTTGNFGAYVSTDGGDSWTVSPDGMFRFSFTDALNGLGVSATGVYRTTDGGATFTQTLAGDAKAVASLSGTAAVAIVDDAFAHSTDGGATWTPGASAEGRTALQAVTSGVVLAWGRGGTFPDYDDRVFRSVDGGASWTDLGEILPDGAWAFAAPGAGSVVAADRAGNMFHSADDGATWSPSFTTPGPFPGFLSSARPAFADASNGYFGFGAGFAIKSTDGGASWTQISSGSGQDVNDMDRFPNGDLIAVGNTGSVLTGDGAGPWILHAQVGTLDLAAVQVLNATDVVMADQSGRLYRSSDAGATWTPGGAVPPSLGVTDVDFTTLLDGWVIGQGFGGGALFHTADGGDSWTPVTDFQGAYTACDFEGTSGWAANVTGLFYRSTDDGATWTQGILPGSSLSIEDMDFWDQGVGYAVGRWGYAARSDDGGVTWTVLPTPNGTDMLTQIHLVGPNEMWVSTNAGVAYYTANGGAGWAILDPNTAGFGNFATIVGEPAGDAWMAGFQGYIEHFTGPPPPPLNQPPSASFDASPVGMTVQFTDTSTDPDGTIISWAWDFGDSSFSTERNPEHTFQTPDTYIVRLTVTDDDLDTGSTIRILVVQPGPGGTFGEFTEVTPLDPLFVTPQNEDFWVAATAPADYDNDGDLDVAVIGFYVVYSQSVEEKLVLFRNDGELTSTEWEFAYIDVPMGTLSSGASDLAWGDVDGDGDQDLLVGTDNQTALFRNDAGTLVLTDTVLPGYWEDNFQADFDLRSITWADYDNDGDLDLLLPSVLNDSTFTYETKLMRNDGPNGTGGFVFGEVPAGFAPTRHAQSAWADFDGDQDMDLLLVHLAPLTDDGFIRRYRNDGNGVFVGEDILGALTLEHGEAQWGDYDNDGDLDILIAGHIKELNGSFTQDLRIYRNDAETYVPIDVITCDPCDGWIDITAATWADYDSDGDVDILLCGSYNSGSQIDGRARVYTNDGSGNFTASASDLPAPRASGSRGGTFSWLDLDGDADLDYFIAGEYFVPGGNGLVEAQMHAYRNDVATPNAPPAMPTQLKASVAGNDVILSWVPGADDHTPTTALTYDLELHSGGAPVVQPRRLPEPGNISAASQWTLAGLPSGSYTWKLRAVDSSYNGSASAQGSFTLGATATPTVATQPLRYELGRNFPNPFAARTTLHFALPERTEVDLSVYDVAGRLVERLLRQPMEPGEHEVAWDARGAASGTYFVKLTAGSYTKTRRVVLLK